MFMESSFTRSMWMFMIANLKTKLKSREIGREYFTLGTNPILILQKQASSQENMEYSTLLCKMEGMDSYGFVEMKEYLITSLLL